MAAEAGSKAPDFTLVNQDRQNVTLSQELGSGNVVLAFFPGAFSGTCTKELCNFRDTMSNFTEREREGARHQHRYVLCAEGVGRSAEARVSAAERLQQGSRSTNYGVVNPDMIGLKNIAKRAVFVVDKGGIIRYREVLDDAQERARLQEAERRAVATSHR